MTATAARPARGRAAAAALLGAAAVAAVFAVALLGGGPAAEPTASTAAVTVTGAPLPPLENPAADPAVGMTAPRIEGAGFDGASLSAPPAGLPAVVLFLAHWCPACQDEVPRVQSWIDGGARPDDVALVAVSTGVDPDRDNYPPAAWFEREGWTVATLVDDHASRAADAYGLPGYPYWVFLDGEGVVLGRHVGGLSTADLERLVERVRELSG